MKGMVMDGREYKRESEELHMVCGRCGNEIKVGDRYAAMVDTWFQTPSDNWLPEFVENPYLAHVECVDLETE